MPDLPPATPHDALFRALLADPGRAETLVREYLPPAVAAELSDAPIRLVDASFVDAVLHQSHSDRLFEARLKDGGSAFVYVLLEHKAAPDPGTPLQMLGYMVRIWQRYAEDRASRLRALPPIVPLIFYHGRERWSGALSVAEMIAGEGELAAFARRLCCVLHDLGQRPLAALSGDPAVWSGLAHGYLVLGGTGRKRVGAAGALVYCENLRAESRGAGDGSAGGEAATLGGADVNGRGSMDAGGQGPG